MTFNQPMGVTARTARYRQVVDQLQYIHLEDFSPGIFSDWQSSNGAQAAPDGAAQLVGTYGCVSSPGGGLMPGPARTRIYTDTPPDTPIDATHYHPLDQNVRIGAMRVFGPMDLDFPTDSPADKIAFIYQWYYDPAGTGVLGNLRPKTRARLFYPAYATSEVIATGTAATINSSGFPLYGPCFIDFSRANNTAPTTVGHTIICFVSYICNSGTTASGSIAYVYPSNAAPATGSQDNILPTFAAGTVPQWVFAHQDRLVFLSGSGNEVVLGGGRSAAETVQFSDPNNYSVISAAAMYDAENPTGFGSFLSMNASTALLIKRAGGAYVMSGALESPTITKLPGVPSADPVNQGAILPNGAYVYGGRRGVWSWNGGDNATLLSPQLDGSFWIPTNLANSTRNAFPPMYGTFASSYPYLFCPNSFIMDTRTGGWWKLTNDIAYAYNERSYNGDVVCSPNYFNSTTQTAVAHYYNVSQGQPTYQWTSQPLKHSIGRFLHFEDFNITAQGSGTVTVSFTGLAGDPPQFPITIPITSTDRPQLINVPISILACDIVVSVTVTSGTGAPAPRIYRMSLGYYEREHAR